MTKQANSAALAFFIRVSQEANDLAQARDPKEQRRYRSDPVLAKLDSIAHEATYGAAVARVLIGKSK